MNTLFNIIDYASLLAYEDKLIVESVCARPNENISVIVQKCHSNLVINLIYTFLTKSRIDNLQKIMHEGFVCNGAYLQSIDIETNFQIIPDFCEKLHIDYLNSDFIIKGNILIRKKSKNNLVETGSVYTEKQIAREIVENTLTNTNVSDDISILDFACGTGRFYENIVEILNSQYGIEKESAVLKNIYAIDIDSIAINITRLKAISYLSSITEEKIQIISQRIILRNALIKNNIFFDDSLYLSDSDLDGKINAGFDAIVSNPPYLVLKINKNKGDKELSEKIQKQVSFFRTSGQYAYSIEGMLNYYQLSVERMLSMLKTGGEIGIICPSSLFADISSTKLRKYLILKNKLRSIKYFGEDAKLFENVTQATNIFYLQKSEKTDSISIEFGDSKFEINVELVKRLFPEQMEIPFISETEWNILDKMSKLKKLKQFTSVRNRRGELDLTLFKEYITTSQTPYRLVRGNMIGEGKIKDINGEYVNTDFIKIKNQDFLKNDFNKKRLICQQISNAGLQKRLKFVFCNENDILGNSCNYLSASPEILEKLYLILNSSLLNWRFKITSTNNHINNYELDELPIVDFENIDKNQKFVSQSQLDDYVGRLYGLNEKEINFLTNK